MTSLKTSRFKDGVFLDIETYSRLPLERGAFVYGRDDSTEIIMLAWKTADMKEPELILDKTLIRRFIHYLGVKNIKIYAHNADFEWHVMRNYSPALKLEQFYCTRLQSAYFGGPHGLSPAGRFWGCDLKVKDGKKLIKWYHDIRNSGGVPETDTVTFNKFCDYCKLDVLACEGIHKIIKEKRGDLPDREIDYWGSSVKMNENGIPIDADYMNLLIDLKKRFERRSTAAFLLKYRASPASSVKIKQIAKRNGDFLETTDKKYIKTKFKKLSKKTQNLFMDKWACSLPTVSGKVDIMPKFLHDGRMYDSHFHHGTRTGRMTSFGVNILNFPRSGDDYIKTSDLFDNKNLNGLNNREFIPLFLRSLVKTIKAPPGKILVKADMKQIEFRILMYFCKRFDILKNLVEGRDIYCDFGEFAFGERPENPSEERTASKFCVLGAGYGATPPRILVTLSEVMNNPTKDISVVLYKAFHKKFPEVNRLHKFFIKRLWSGEGSIRLFNGKPLFWNDLDTKDGEKITGYTDYKNGGFVNIPLDKPHHGAKCTAHYVSATAREIIMIKQKKCIDSGLNVVKNKHDELVTEIEIGDDDSMLLFKKIMEEQVPGFSFPFIQCEFDLGERY